MAVFVVCGLVSFGRAAPSLAEVLSPQRALPGEGTALPETRKSVAIISILGRRVFGITRGITSTQVDAIEPDWRIDRLILQQVENALADRFHPRAIELDWPAVSKASLAGRSLFSGADQQVDALRKTVQPGAVDLIVIVRHTVVADPFGGTNTGVSGYGVFVSDGLFGRTGGRAYLVCSIVAIDGTRMKEIGERQCLGTAGFLAPTIPFRKLDEAMTKTRLPEYDRSQLDWLHEALQAMVIETVPRTLAKLDLTREPPKNEGDASERSPQEQSTR